MTELKSTARNLNIAYLTNTYPYPSSTFIRQEIEALEERGLDIRRYSVRQFDGQLVDPRDRLETKRTSYLLTGNVRGLFTATLMTALLNPLGFFRSLFFMFRLIRNSRGNYLKHLAYLMQAAYFYRSAKFGNIDHVHVHFASNATTVALLAHLMGGPTYSFTVHGPDELLDPTGLSFSLKIEHAAFVIAISQFCRDFLLKYAPAGSGDKLIIARCGLAMEDFSDNDLAARASQTLVCVGRLCPQKGQLLIPKAAARLRHDFPNLKIILVGDGETRQRLEEQIRINKVNDIVELRGWLDNRSVLRLVESSRALLLPSYAEGLPVAIMESLALGTPVISTTIAGIPELVDQECGWLFPAGDEERLVEAMRAALECPPSSLKKMSQVGRERVARLHDRRILAKILHDRFIAVVKDIQVNGKDVDGTYGMAALRNPMPPRSKH